MILRPTKLATLILAAALLPATVALAAPSSLQASAVNDASLTPVVADGKAEAAAILRAQILLERAHFSPGEIDGRWGTNTRRAIQAFQRARGIDVSGTVDEPTWKALNEGGGAVLVEHSIAAAEVEGPFRSTPAGMEAKAKLDRLPYASATEALGEKFHARPQLLEQLNPGSDLGAGTTIWVPNVTGLELAKPARVVVDESDSAVLLEDEAGKVYAYFPATTGSSHDPLPIGDWKIQGVAIDPTFHYSPELFWDSEPDDSKAVIPPGPNNPVGTVWIDLSKEHYGIHGTPEPSLIGKTQSHGCIRMTNWSATAVAKALEPGTPAILQK